MEEKRATTPRRQIFEEKLVQSNEHYQYLLDEQERFGLRHKGILDQQQGLLEK